MHREEGQIDADEHDPEMDLAQHFRILAARHLTDPVIETREDPEQGAHRHGVVEMADHVIGVLEHYIHPGIGQHHAGNAADREQEDHAKGKQHRRGERDRAAPHGGDPAEDLDARRHRDHQGRGDEVGAGVDIQANRVHVVRPHDEADDADRHHGVGHAEVTEHRLLREGGHHLADDAERGQDQDVDLGVAEEPEQVLVEDRIAAAGGIEEGGAEVPVGQQHGDRPGKNGQGEEQ